jgi:hypothetical protein
VPVLGGETLLYAILRKMLHNFSSVSLRSFMILQFVFVFMFKWVLQDKLYGTSFGENGASNGDNTPLLDQLEGSERDDVGKI